MKVLVRRAQLDRAVHDVVSLLGIANDAGNAQDVLHGNELVEQLRIGRRTRMDDLFHFSAFPGDDVLGQAATRFGGRSPSNTARAFSAAMRRAFLKGFLGDIGDVRRDEAVVEAEQRIVLGPPMVDLGRFLLWIVPGPRRRSSPSVRARWRRLVVNGPCRASNSPERRLRFIRCRRSSLMM